MTTAIVTEKPAVARDIARVLGAKKRGEGLISGGGWVITWGFGHLVGLAQPHEIDPRWKRWRPELLPMLPAAWPLVVAESSEEQFDVVARVLRDDRVKDVVCATDAGREGRLLYQRGAGPDHPVHPFLPETAYLKLQVIALD